MAKTIKMDVVITDDSTGVTVPGHEFHMTIPGQNDKQIETFVDDLTKFGEQERKKATHGNN